MCAGALVNARLRRLVFRLRRPQGRRGTDALHAGRRSAPQPPGRGGSRGAGRRGGGAVAVVLLAPAAAGGARAVRRPGEPRFAAAALATLLGAAGCGSVTAKRSDGGGTGGSHADSSTKADVPGDRASAEDARHDAPEIHDRAPRRTCEWSSAGNRRFLAGRVGGRRRRRGWRRRRVPVGFGLHALRRPRRGLLRCLPGEERAGAGPDVVPDWLRDAVQELHVRQQHVHRQQDVALRDAPESPRVLIVPGLGGSGPQHWQTRWEVLYPRHDRLVQRDWDHPERDDWLAALGAALEAAREPVVLVAHSLGCALVAHAAARPYARPSRRRCWSRRPTSIRRHTRRPRPAASRRCPPCRCRSPPPSSPARTIPT